MHMQHTGFVLYKGPSLIDGQPIVAIATLSTNNPKTGPMVQTWILPDNGIAPNENTRSGADVSVCGDCKHRPVNGGACYVRVGAAPRSVYAKYLRGGYESAVGAATVRLGAGRMVRLGSYGDPAAVPAHVWEQLTRLASGRTGYTHQWHSLEARMNEHNMGAQRDVLRSLVMASCDTPEEREEARKAGWRTFTVRLESDPLAAHESTCPASKEAGAKVTCSQCRMCDGAASGKRGSIAILAHGPTAKRYREFRLAVSMQ